MKKLKTITSFVCQECGYDSPSWLGKCPECETWNSMKEFHLPKTSGSSVVNSGIVLSDTKPKTLKEIAYSERLRLQTNFSDNTLSEIALSLKSREHETGTPWTDVFWEKEK